MSCLYYSIQDGNYKLVEICNYNVYYKSSNNYSWTTALTLSEDKVEKEIKNAGGFKKGWCFTGKYLIVQNFDYSIVAKILSQVNYMSIEKEKAFEDEMMIIKDLIINHS